MENKTLVTLVNSVAVTEFLINKKDKGIPKKLSNNLKTGKTAVTKGIKRLSSCQTQERFLSSRDYF